MGLWTGAAIILLVGVVSVLAAGQRDTPLRVTIILTSFIILVAYVSVVGFIQLRDDAAYHDCLISQTRSVGNREQHLLIIDAIRKSGTPAAIAFADKLQTALDVNLPAPNPHKCDGLKP